MKLKPILFNTEMVQAILEGRKTQTRRIVKGIEGLNVYRAEPAEDAYETLAEWDFFHGLFFFCEENSGFADAIQSLRAPYAVGDILWVRETWSTTDKCGLFPNWPASFTHHYLYKADDPDCVAAKEARWYPSIHMPKEAARIFLRVTDVRVEHLREITVEGCAAEGIWDDYKTHSEKYHENLKKAAYPKAFSELWNSTIKKDDLPKYGWDANPWVWVIQFERCEMPDVSERKG